MSRLLEIENAHVDSCGNPPLISNRDFDYVSYFENRYGEQLVFYREVDGGPSWVQMGDCGWNNKFAVTEGLVECVLSKEESLFIGLCWETSRTFAETQSLKERS